MRLALSPQRTCVTTLVLSSMAISSPTVPLMSPSFLGVNTLSHPLTAPRLHSPTHGRTSNELASQQWLSTLG